MPTSRVALVRGEERYDNVSHALERIADKIDLSNKQRVLVKPSFVVTHKPLAAAHVDGVPALLEFAGWRYDGPITVAEGPVAQPAAEGFCLHLARSIVESDLRISVGPPKTHDVVIATLSLKNMIMVLSSAASPTANPQTMRTV